PPRPASGSEWGFRSQKSDARRSSPSPRERNEWGFRSQMPEDRRQKNHPLAPRAERVGVQKPEIRCQMQKLLPPRPASECEWGEGGAHRASDGKVRGKDTSTLTRSHKLRS